MNIRIAGFDPGGSTGYVTVLFNPESKKGTLQQAGVFPKESVFRDINGLGQIDLFVIEDYKIRDKTTAGGYEHQWSDGFALQVIGALKYAAELRGIPVVLQQPAVKPVAYGFLGSEYRKGKKNMHHMDALAHVLYHLVRVRGADPNCLHQSLPSPL